MKKADNKYKSRLAKGLEVMKGSSVAICSLVRDCGTSLEKNIPKVEELRAKFLSSEVIVVENDSKDNTKSILKKWENHSEKVTVISNDFGTITIPQATYNHPKSQFFSKGRIEKMAKYRNIYLSEIKKKTTSPDFVIMIDLDVFDFPLEGIVNSFGFEKEWDSINANGKKITPESPIKPLFYDTYAFKELEDTTPTTYDELKENQKKFGSLKKRGEFFRVNSGFNGLAIYKWSAIQNLEYKAIPNNDEVVLFKCEHVSFHEDMIESGFDKIYLNPSMVVNYEKINVKLYLNKLKEKLS